MIADHAVAEIFIRVVGEVAELRDEIREAAEPDAQAHEVLFIPACRLGAMEGFRTTVVSFTSDIPAFNGAWGEPFLIGPGSIHVAHTAEEHILKSQLEEAVDIYANLVRRLSR